MPFKLCEKVEGGFLLGTWEAAVRAAKPNQATAEHPPSQTVAHKENSRFEVDKEKTKVTHRWPCVCIS